MRNWVIRCSGHRWQRPHPSLAALVLTEVNPTHDPSGRLLDRYLDGIVTALTT